MECLDSNLYPDCLALLAPTDIRQYLFVIKPTSMKVVSAALRQGQLTLGKLNIVWQGPMGETGRLTTAQLTRKLSPPPLISSLGAPNHDVFQYDLLLNAQPSPVKPQEPFVVDFTLFVKPTRQLEGQRSPLHLVIQHVDHSKTPKVESELASAIGKTATSSGKSTPLPERRHTFPPPSPFSKSTADPSILPSASLVYLGPSLVHLASVEIPPTWSQSAQRPHAFSTASSVDSSQAGIESDTVFFVEEPLAVPFSMQYLVLSPEITNIGGIRVFSVEQNGSIRRVAEFETVAQLHVKS
jgi:hypothetical protein